MKGAGWPVNVMALPVSFKTSGLQWVPHQTPHSHVSLDGGEGMGDPPAPPDGGGGAGGGAGGTGRQ